MELIGSQNKKDEITKAKDEKIFLLEKELMNYKNRDLLVTKASKEVAILFPEVQSFSFGELTFAASEEEESETRPSLLVKWKRKPSVNQKKKLVTFLQSRLNIEEEIEVIHE